MALRNGLILLMTLTVVQVFGTSLNIYENIYEEVPEDRTTEIDEKFPDIETHNITEANLNSMFDKNLEWIKEMIYEKNLDPLEMPDRMLGLPESAPVAKFHLRNGWVQQLATIKRTGDVLARYHGKNLTLEFDLGWDHIDVNYAYMFKALFYSRQGIFHGYFNNMRIAAQGTINLENYNMDLKFFNIVDAGYFRFELSGHLSDYILNLISRAVSVLAKDRILREIEYYFVKSIREKIDEVNELLPEPMRQRIEYLNKIRNYIRENY